MKRALAVPVCVALLSPLLATGGAAQAAPPDHGSVSVVNRFVDSDVCAPEGFDVNVVEAVDIDYTNFFDADGNFVRAVLHYSYQTTLQANGHTLIESDHWQDTYYADGRKRTVGLSVHIKGTDHKIVQLDAGQIRYNADGSIASVSGPHPQFLGQTFCFALTP